MNTQIDVRGRNQNIVQDDSNEDDDNATKKVGNGSKKAFPLKCHHDRLPVPKLNREKLEKRIIREQVSWRRDPIFQIHASDLPMNVDSPAPLVMGISLDPPAEEAALTQNS